MKKIMPILFLLLTITLMSIASATEPNDTLDDSQEDISQENELYNKNVDFSNENQGSLNYKETNIKKELDDETGGTGCSSVLIQGYNNDSSISFRRDATNKLTVNVKHNNSIIKQYKDGSYFVHVIISKDGWMIGNGGADNAAVNYAIENNVLAMINKNTITSTNINNIYKEKSKLSLGHFVIKSPNGTYSLIIKNGNRIFKDEGVLKPGQYLIVPNSVNYFKKGTIADIKSENSMIYSSRMLTARDGFGVNRRGIVTYYYKNNVLNSTVKVYACNDNGKYVGRSTGGKMDNFRTNTKYFSSSSIPMLDNAIMLDNINFVLRKAKTYVSSENIVVNTDKALLKAEIKDEFGNKVNTGFVSFLVDDKTIKNNGNTVYVNVTNGLVSYEASIANFWKRNNHTYYIRYYSNSKYEPSLGNKAFITKTDLANITTYHSKSLYYENTMLIVTSIRNFDASYIKSGVVFYKINGKTVRNADNSTLFIDVTTGLTRFNYTFDTRYKARTYNLTTIYVNGIYRKEITTNFTIKKIPTKVISPKLSVQSNNLNFSGKIVDNNGKLLRYDTYASVKINGITLKNNDNTTRIFNITNGNIFINFIIPYKLKPGNHTFNLVLPELRETLSFRGNYTFKIS